MMDGLAIFEWIGVAAALVASHVLVYRWGCSRARNFLPVPEAGSPSVPTLVVDNSSGAQSALQALGADFAAMPAYADTLLCQIDGVKRDTQDGITLVINEVDAINGQAREQIVRMHASLDGSEALARSSERPRAIIDNLRATLDQQTGQIRSNFDSLNALTKEFDTLRPIIATISTIADKAFFLSINAAVEAARAGSAGAAFGLVAEEVRALSKLTQTASKEIDAGIASFTGRMRAELERTRPHVEGANGELEKLIMELSEIQGNLANAGNELTAMIHAMDGGHRQMVERLTSILGHVQFQDIVRQRLDQVQTAIRDLDDHIATNMARALSEDAPDLLSLPQVLHTQQAQYVMESQRAAFATAVSGGVVDRSDAPKIELF